MTKFKFLKLVTNLPFKKVAGEAVGAAGVPSEGGGTQVNLPSASCSWACGSQGTGATWDLLCPAQRLLDSCMFLCI